MPVTAAKDLLRTLAGSNLLSKSQLKRLLVQVERARGEVSAQKLASVLVEQKLISRWQAEMLLSGRKGFFLGRYKLLDQLGQGGMGAVFKAEQLGLGRIVALKLMAENQLKNEAAVARFHQEIKAAAALDHPNIVTAYDADCVGGAHFLVMEHVDGVDLGSIGKEQPGQLPIGWVCECIRQTAIALEYAHSKGMIHRDIKPANLLVCQRDGTNEPWVKVLDMGLARFVSEVTDQTALTSTGQVMGTPDYIAPEQAQSARSADIRSDIFSLGCTAFRLFTGELPFPGENMMEKLTARLTQPSLPMRPFRREIPRELEYIVGKMLDRDPAKRFQTPGEVVEAIAPFAGLSPDDPVVDPANRALGQLIIRERYRSADPEFNRFLDQLASEEVDDQETYQSLSQDTEDAPEATATRRSSRSGRTQRFIDERRAAEMRRWMWGLTAAVTLVFLMAGYWFWDYSGRTTLVVDLEEDAREGISLSIDRVPVDFQKIERLEFPGRWGNRRVTLERAGYQPIDELVDLGRGETHVFRPKWVMLPDTARLHEWTELRQEVMAAARNFGEPPPLREDLFVRQLVSKLEGFRERWNPSEEARQANELLLRLPLPVDLLLRKQIPLWELEAAGNGDPRQAPPELAAVMGDSRLNHGEPIESMAIASDGKLLATTGGDYLRLFDLETGRATWSSHGGGGSALFFNPQKSELIGWRGNTLRFWDYRNSTGRSDVAQPTGILAMDLTSNGALMAVGTRDGVEIREKTGSVIQRKIATERPVHSVAFSPDETQLAFGGELGLLGIIHLETGTVAQWLQGVNSNGTSVDWSSDGSRLVSGHLSGHVIEWRVADGARLRSTRFNSRVNSNGVRFTEDDNSLIVSHGRTVEVFDLAALEPRWSHTGRAFVELRNPERIAISRGGTVEIRDLDSGELLSPRDSHGPLTRARSLAISRDGNRLASGHADGTISLWDIRTGSETDVLRAGESGLSALEFSPDGSQLACGSDDGVLTLWSLATRKPLWRTRADHFRIHSLTFSADGSQVATFGAEPNVYVWSVSDGRSSHVIHTVGYAITALAFDPQAQHLVGADSTNKFRVWDTTTWELERTIPISGGASAISFSPDGSQVALALNSGEINLIETRSWSKSRSMRVERGRANGLSYSSDGRLLAALENDGNISIWDAKDNSGPRTAQKSLRLDSADIRANSIQMTPEGRHVVVASEDSISVFRLAPALGARAEDPGAPLQNPRIVAPSEDQLFATSRRMNDQAAMLAILNRRIAVSGQAYDYLYRSEVLSDKGDVERALTDYEVAQQKAGQQVPAWFPQGWWVIGGYPPSLQAEYPPEQHADPNAQVPLVAADGTLLTQTQPWQQVSADDGMIDFLEIFDRPTECCTYAMHRGYSSVDRQIAVLMGSDDGVRLWVNGEMVFENDVARSVNADQDAVLVTLKAGWNTLLFKVSNGIGDHGLQMRLSDSPSEIARARAHAMSDQVDFAELHEELKLAPHDAELRRMSMSAAWNAVTSTTDDSQLSRQVLETAELLLATSPDQGDNKEQRIVLVPVDVQAQGGTELTLQPDGSVFAAGVVEEQDRYTITLPIPSGIITGLALEIIPDARLPFGRTGRSFDNGNFVINQLELSQLVDGEANRIEVRRASVDYAVTSRPIENVLDENESTWWDPFPRQSDPHVLLLELVDPIQGGPNQLVSLSIDCFSRQYPHHGLGRFRVWGLTATPPLKIEPLIDLGQSVDATVLLALAQLRAGDTSGAAQSVSQLNPVFTRPTGIMRLLSLMSDREHQKSGTADNLLTILEDWRIGSSLPGSDATLLKEVLTAALESSPDHIELLGWRAELSEQLGQPEQARIDYSRLEALDPDNPMWRTRLSFLEPGVNAAWGFDSGVDGWRAQNGCSIVPADGALQVSRSEDGRAPSIRHELDAPAGWKKLTLRMRHAEEFSAMVRISHQRGLDHIGSVSVPFASIPSGTDGWTDYVLFLHASGKIQDLSLGANWSGEEDLSIDAIELRDSSIEEAIDYYRAKVAETSGHPGLLRLYCEFLARTGRWQDAAAAFPELLRAVPADHWQAFHAAAVLRFVDDADTYRQHRRSMLSSWGGDKTTDPVIVERTLKAVTLDALPTVERKAVSELSEWLATDGLAGVEGGQRGWFTPWVHLSTGMAAYRGSDYGLADDRLAKAVATSGSNHQYVRPTALLFRAMANEKLQQPETARALYQEAVRIIDTQLPLQEGDGDLGAQWFDWLVVQIALREAKQELAVE